MDGGWVGEGPAVLRALTPCGFGIVSALFTFRKTTLSTSSLLTVVFNSISPEKLPLILRFYEIRK